VSEPQTIALKMAKPTDADNDAMLAFMQLVETLCMDGEDADGNYVDDAERFQSLVEAAYRTVNARWTRVLYAGMTAISNACDPNADVLEWKPEIAVALEARAAKEPTP